MAKKEKDEQTEKQEEQKKKQEELLKKMEETKTAGPIKKKKGRMFRWTRDIYVIKDHNL